MFMSKGQASLMDIVMLATAISIVVVIGTFFNSQQQINTEQAREWSVYSQASFTTASKYRGDFSSVIKDMRDVSLSETVLFWFCEQSSNQSSIEKSAVARDIFDPIIPENYLFIYYAEDSVKRDALSININNGQQAVCAKEIPLVSQEVSYICPSGQVQGVKFLFGMWPKWKKYPLAC